MLIVGAKGFAKEVLEVLHQSNDIDHLVFYDDVNLNIPTLLYDRFSIIQSFDEAKYFFETVEQRFTVGIGNPMLRQTLANKFITIGGKFTSTISPKADIGHYGNEIGIGCNIMSGTILTNDIKVSEGVLINLNCTVGHDCVIGKYVEMSPGVHISGNCQIGDFCNIGTNATILPRVKLGNNVTIGAGAVVTQDIPDNAVAVGIPAKVIKFKENE